MDLRIYDVPDIHADFALSVARRMEASWPDRVGLRNGVAFLSQTPSRAITLWAYRTPKGMIVVRGTVPQTTQENE